MPSASAAVKSNEVSRYRHRATTANTADQFARRGLDCTANSIRGNFDVTVQIAPAFHADWRVMASIVAISGQDFLEELAVAVPYER